MAANEPPESACIRRATACGGAIATAESCTGGLIGHRLTNVPGASRVYLGGVIAYANAVKAAALGVPDGLIAAEGAVSEAVARAMALGAARAFGARFAVGVTGIAGPGGGTPEKPVGLVHIAACDGGRIVAARHVFAGGRDVVKRQSADAALELLREMMPE